MRNKSNLGDIRQSRISRKFFKAYETAYTATFVFDYFDFKLNNLDLVLVNRITSTSTCRE